MTDFRVRVHQSLTWDKLSTLVTSSLEKVREGEFASISAALIPVMPEIILALKDIATSPTTTAAGRISAVELLMTMWSRCLRGDLRVQKVAATRLKHTAAVSIAQSERHRAAAQDKKATLAIARERKAAARKLKKLKEAQEQNVTTN